MKRQWLTAVLVAATASGVAFAQEAKKEGKKGGMAKSVNVRMHAQNKSGESGTAKLTPQGAEMMRSRREMRVRRAAEALAHLPEAQRERTLQAIRALLEASQATAPAPPHEDPISIRLEQ